MNIKQFKLLKDVFRKKDHYIHESKMNLWTRSANQI